MQGQSVAHGSRVGSILIHTETSPESVRFRSRSYTKCMYPACICIVSQSHADHFLHVSLICMHVSEEEWKGPALRDYMLT